MDGKAGLGRWKKGAGEGAAEGEEKDDGKGETRRTREEFEQWLRERKKARGSGERAGRVSGVGNEGRRRPGGSKTIRQREGAT